jgi:hypothetical protein
LIRDREYATCSDVSDAAGGILLPEAQGAPLDRILAAVSGNDHRLL